MAIEGFAGTLRKLRKERNLTQKQLADAVSLSQRQISLLESDKEVPRAETIERLRHFFNLDIDTWNNLLEQESKLSAQAIPPDTIGHFGQSGTFLWIHRPSMRAMAVLTDYAFGTWAKPLWSETNDAIWRRMNEG